jgi:hypothetical protein
VGVAFGTKVGENGHFEFSAQHRETSGILDRVGSRSWDNLAALQGSGTSAAPYVLATDVRLSQYTFGGLIASKTLAGGAAYTTLFNSGA